MSILSNFTAYVKQVWANRPTLTSPLSAARLNHMEAGIKANSDAVEAISNAVISNIINDPNKIASMATAYALQQQITQLNSETVTTYADSERINLHSTKGIHNLCLAKDGIFAAPILILNTGIGNDSVYSLAFEFDENTQKWKLHLYDGNRVWVGTIVSA